jgi:hypothetical protein
MPVPVRQYCRFTSKISGLLLVYDGERRKFMEETTEALKNLHLR